MAIKRMVHNLAPTPIQPAIYQQFRGCEKKKRYEKRFGHGSAEAAIESIKRNGTDKKPHRTLNSYKCNTCFGWHVGHLPDGRRKTEAQIISESSI
jgi:hypothetical protein